MPSPDRFHSETPTNIGGERNMGQELPVSESVRDNPGLSMGVMIVACSHISLESFFG